MRKIAVVTGTRAEYGLLRWLMQEIDEDPALELQLVVTGTHLSAQHGNTVREIEGDGFRVDERVDMLLSGDSDLAVAKSIGVATMGFADALSRLRPHVVVVLGDRFEILAAAQAAMCLQIPIAHLHGGEATEGVIDESIRHAVTKMAHFHFVATERYKRRVEQLGEDPARVFNHGAPGLDNLTRLTLLDRASVGAELGMEFADPTFLVTYHPETLAATRAGRQAEVLVQGLDRFPSARIVFTMANADAGGHAINEVLRRYADEHPERTRFFQSLGQLRYLSALQAADVIVGNSSSGLLEAPSVQTPTVNIGERQRGRERAASVIDCELDADAISAAITAALAPSFRQQTSAAVNPYGAPGASIKIKNQLKVVELEGVLKKRFHDLF